MNLLRTGFFFGETNTKIDFGSITLTDTEYTHERVDWHYHENAYFTFILQGRLIEGSKRETYNCANGSLLFHSQYEPHYNLKPEGYTRGFHIELNKNCFSETDFDISRLEGSFSLENPDIKLRFYRIFRETKIFDEASPVSIQMLLLETFQQMRGGDQSRFDKKPRWAKKLAGILRDDCATQFTLKTLANELNIHPVHLSRGFSKHFLCTFGEYIRKIRIENSLALLPAENLTLTEIAYRCGFFDQSHFLRCFKQIVGMSPSGYRKILRGKC